MSEVKLKPGGGFTTRGNKSLKDNTLSAALEEQSICHPCGCNSCNGVRSWYNPQTGEVLGSYITGPVGGPYVMVIEPIATAHANANALVSVQA